ncbi:MAG: glycosyltransferase family 9 protein [Ardenticatenales bacterium]
MPPDPIVPPPARSIVFHSGTLGDLVLSFWVLRSLAARGEVWIVAPWRAAQLAARCVEGVVPVDGDQPRFARLHAPAAVAIDMLAHDPDLADALRSATSIVSFVARRDDPWAATVRALAPHAAIAFISPRPPDDGATHITAWCAAQLGPTLPGLGTAADWPAPASSVRGSPDNRPVLIHPGSGAAVKCWSADRFADLARILAERGHAVRIVLGEAEYERWTEVALRSWRAEFDVRVSPTLPDLEALLRGAAAFIGNDSGPTHLAAALGVPTIALFGPTSPAVWRPVGADVTVLAPVAPSPMEWLSVETAAAAITARLGAPDSLGGAPA